MIPGMHDPQTLSAADLTTALRRWLRARREPSEVQAAALVFEMTALLALQAKTIPDAYVLIEIWARQMKAQVDVLGVGVEHP